MPLVITRCLTHTQDLRQPQGHLLPVGGSGASKDTKICFILDESSVMDSGFLEPLPNAEARGRFKRDEHNTLMTQGKEGAQRS